jgi:hypothetical protein
MNVLELPGYFYTRGRGYFAHGPRHLLMYVFGRFGAIRSLVVWIYSLRAAQPRPASGPTLIEDVDVDDAARKLSQDGLFPGLQLRSEVVEQLLAFSSVATCFGNRKPDLPFRYHDKAIAEQRSAQTFGTASYNQALRASPVIQSLTTDPQLIAIARRYLRTEPVLIGARMWWSFAASADPKRQIEMGPGFHYDIDGYRAVAFFFYLTDVGLSNGPHLYIRGSNSQKSLRHLLSLYKSREDAEIEKYYGPERQVILCGPAGFGFAEDIFGFHKGLHPKSGDRLILQVRYGIRDYGTGRND